MIYTKIIEIPKQELIEMQKFLDSEGDGTLNTIATYTTNFGEKEDTGEIEVDIKVCDGEGNPFVDAVIFEDGQEIGCLEVRDELVGEYSFSIGTSDIFKVVVKER